MYYYFSALDIVSAIHFVSYVALVSKHLATSALILNLLTSAMFPKSSIRENHVKFLQWQVCNSDFILRTLTLSSASLQVVQKVQRKLPHN